MIERCADNGTMWTQQLLHVKKLLDTYGWWLTELVETNCFIFFRRNIKYYVYRDEIFNTITGEKRRQTFLKEVIFIRENVIAVEMYIRCAI